MKTMLPLATPHLLFLKEAGTQGKFRIRSPDIHIEYLIYITTSGGLPLKGIEG